LLPGRHWLTAAALLVLGCHAVQGHRARGLAFVRDRAERLGASHRRIDYPTDCDSTAGELLATAEEAYRDARRLDGLLPAPALPRYRDAAVTAIQALAVAPDDADFIEIATDVHNRAVERLVRLAQDVRVRGRGTWQEVLAETGVGLQGVSEYLNPARFKELVPTRDIRARGLREWFDNPGVGVTLVANRDNERVAPADPRDRLYPEKVRAATTAVLHLDDSAPTLVLHDPFEESAVVVGERTLRMATDRSTPFAVQLAWSNLKKAVRSRPFHSKSYREESGLNLVRSYQPGRIPVVFVHGLNSSPVFWKDTVNELSNDPMLCQRFQFWLYLYPTGAPIPASAARLRRDLREALAILDPCGQDPALGDMVLVGHSIGGMVIKMATQDSGSALWDALFTRGPDELRLSPEARRALVEALFFRPEPYVRRLVFVSTPHEGTPITYRWLAQLYALLSREVDEVHRAMREVVRENGRGALAPGIQVRRFYGVGGLRPTDSVLQAESALPIDPSVPYHSIIPQLGIGPWLLPTDGIVPYWSSHIDGADSELIFRGFHTAQDRPPSTAEIRRILLEHLEN
jgi:pimeloyl-ACP methyl ester carboxylesterase